MEKLTLKDEPSSFVPLTKPYWQTKCVRLGDLGGFSLSANLPWSVIDWIAWRTDVSPEFYPSSSYLGTIGSFEYKNSVSSFKTPRLARIDYFPEVTSVREPKRPRMPVYHPPRFKPLKVPMINGVPISESNVESCLPSSLKKFPKLNFAAGLNKRKSIGVQIVKLRARCLEQYRWFTELTTRQKNMLRDYDRRFQWRLSLYRVQLKKWEVKHERWRLKKPPIYRFRRIRRNKVTFTQQNPFTWTSYSGGHFGIVDTYGSRGQAQHGYVRHTNPPTWIGSSFPDYPNWYSCYLQRVLIRTTPVVSTPLEIARSFHLQLEGVLTTQIGSIENKVLRKMAAKVANQDVHVAQLLAERVQTAELFFSSVRRLADLLKGKKTLLRKAVGYFKPKTIADDYLAFKFGVQPLIQDVHNSAQLFAEFSEETDNDQAEMYVNVRSNSSRNVETSVMIGGVYFKFRGRITVSHYHKWRVETNIARVLQRLGLVNPAEVAWELMPWSFVVDWFYPVGEVITQLTRAVGVSFVHGTRTVHIVGTFTRSGITPFTPNVSPFGALFSQGREELTVTSRGMNPVEDFTVDTRQRTVFTTEPICPMPEWKNPLSFSHGFLAAALSVQQLFKHHNP